MGHVGIHRIHREALGTDGSESMGVGVGCVCGACRVMAHLGGGTDLRRKPTQSLGVWGDRTDSEAHVVPGIMTAGNVKMSSGTDWETHSGAVVSFGTE